jgi:hypothetical protein
MTFLIIHRLNTQQTYGKLKNKKMGSSVDRFLLTAKEKRKGPSAMVYMGRMGGEIFSCTDQKKKASHFSVWPTQEDVQNHSMKCYKMHKLQYRWPR